MLYKKNINSYVGSPFLIMLRRSYEFLHASNLYFFGFNDFVESYSIEFGWYCKVSYLRLN